ncbi:hypothetical protein ACP4OV_008298 [Aristida adscensionis]
MPLPVLRDGGRGGFELVVPTGRRVPPPPEVFDDMYDGYLEGTYDPFEFEDVMCVLSPEADDLEKSASDGGGCPWRMLGRRFPPEFEAQPFMTEAQFSFDGKAFFVELDQSIAYADLPAVAGVIPLPKEIPPQQRWEQSKKSKLESTVGFINDRWTMRYVGGAIRFVCIDPVDHDAGQVLGDGKVTAWTLDLRSRRWTKDWAFRTRQLWRAAGLAGGRLPAAEPKCPVLMPDGTLCVLMPELILRREDPSLDYVCNLEVRHGDLRVVWSGALRDCRYEEPPLLRFDFFKKLCALDPSKEGPSSIYVEH